MEFLAATEAQRLDLFHLARVFFHDTLPDLRAESVIGPDDVRVTLCTSAKAGSATVPIEEARHKEKRRAQKAAVGLAFAQAARAFGDYVPPYGTLIGVRPVKAALYYLENGQNADQVRRLLEQDYCVRTEKAALLVRLAELERAEKERLTPSDVLLYVSIPFCPSRCRYCSFISSSAPKRQDLIDQYLNLLIEELRLTALFLAEEKKTAVSVYVGGGTPGILTPVQLEKLLEALQERFPNAMQRETCVEIGRPDTVTLEKLSLLKQYGVGRICINPQTTSDETLLRIGRGHTANDFFRAMKQARSFGFSAVNCDLIAGLPGETESVFRKSVADVLALQPENVTIHALCQKRSAEETFSFSVGENWRAAVEAAHESCEKEGLFPYYLYRQKSAAADLENLGFAKRGTESRYNLFMMEDLCDVFACGAGAIAKIVPKCKGGRILRFSACKYPYEYTDQPERIRQRIERMKEAYAKENG